MKYDAAYLQKIFVAINSIADIEVQKVEWSGANPEKISSFTEELSLLFDVLEFETFIERIDSIEFLVKNQELKKSLLKFNSDINQFKKIGYNLELQKEGYKKILESNDWISITA